MAIREYGPRRPPLPFGLCAGVRQPSADNRCTWPSPPTRWWPASPALANFKAQAAVAILIAVLDTALGDLHGISYLVGFALVTAWVVRDGVTRPLVRARGRPALRRQ
jgi:hypothetical protein